MLGRLVRSLRDSIKEAGKIIGFVPFEEEEHSLTKNEVLELFNGKNALSKYILPEYYDPEIKLYINSDNTVGFMFECMPVLVLGMNSISAFHSFLKTPFPKGAIMQIILFADPYVDPYLIEFYERKQNSPSFVQKGYRNLIKYYKKGLFGFPVRNFRCFVTLKFPYSREYSYEFYRDLRNAVIESFTSARIPIWDCPPEVYLSLMRRILNDSIKEEVEIYNELIPLRKQIILAETEIRRDKGSIFVGKRQFRGMSPKSFPQVVNSFFMNYVTGSFDGPSGDSIQIFSPFFICMTIVLSNQKMEIVGKANLILQQQALGSFVVSINRKKEEYVQALKLIDDGEIFYPVFFTIWIFDEDYDRLSMSFYKAKRMWEACGCVMQEEKFITFPLFLYSLPFGFVDGENQRKFLDRDFILPGRTIAALFPLQADFAGTGEPSMIFLGRKGQIVTMDLFSKSASSYNFFIVAPSGKGKSFLANYLISCYLGQGVKVRVVDIGGSYRKLCSMLGGKYIEFSREANVCINFFELIRDEETDIPVVVQVLAEMARVNTGELPERVTPETAINVLRSAVNIAYRMKGSNTLIDDVYDILRNFTKYFDDSDLLCKEENQECYVEFTSIATHLAFNLFRFTTLGEYGKYFNGKTTVDVTQDDFVVLELEQLKTIPDLFGVVTLGVLLLVTQDLYLSDRSVPRLILVDEAHMFLQDTPAFQKVIEEGYRRARKYYGSFGIITQSILDFEGFGRVGRVINSNSPFKFFLESRDFRKAKELGLLPINDDFVLSLMESVRYNAPKYSEIFIYTDHAGFGIARLCVDAYSYYLFTSNPRDIVKLEELVSQGMSYSEAISTLVKEKGETIEDDEDEKDVLPVEGAFCQISN